MVALALATLLIFFLPRRHVVAPVFLLSMLIPLGQQLMVGPFHFQVFRILVLVGWIRLLIQKGKEGADAKLKINGIDKAVIGYALTCIVCYTLLWQESGAFFNQVGAAYTILGSYFLFRFFIRDQEDVERAIKVMAVGAAVIGALMINEQVTGRNVLAIFGGVPENTVIRAGYLRSQGPFMVYLTAGAFGATQFPLFLAMWRKGGRLMAMIGMAAAIAITVTSKTSTASSAILAAVIGIAMWPARNYMRVVRWGLVCMITGLHLVMKAPVWALIQRVDLVGGSDGWHRFMIVDNFIRHFSDWWLLGARNYMTWEGGGDMWDLANQYVFIGETTGLLSLAFFLATIVYSFKYLGRARIAAAEDDPGKAWFLWLLGVTIVSNMVAFMGISYFDQIVVYWYLFLALVVAASRESLEPVEEILAEEAGAIEEAQEWPAMEGTPAGASLYGQQ
jgi:hypothetical protein